MEALEGVTSASDLNTVAAFANMVRAFYKAGMRHNVETAMDFW